MPDRRFLRAFALCAPILLAAGAAEGRTREAALGVFAVVSPICTASTNAGPAVRCAPAERATITATSAPDPAADRRDAPRSVAAERPPATKFFTISF